MSHDRNTIHVSHYENSPTWRTCIAPLDRSWLLFVDVSGAPHLYLATQTESGEGVVTTTYAPCVRAMLRAEDTAATIPLPIPTPGKFTITVERANDGGGYLAFCGDSLKRPGATVREAVLAALEEAARDLDKGEAALAL